MADFWNHNEHAWFVGARCELEVHWHFVGDRLEWFDQFWRFFWCWSINLSEVHSHEEALWDRVSILLRVNDVEVVFRYPSCDSMYDSWTIGTRKRQNEFSVSHCESVERSVVNVLVSISSDEKSWCLAEEWRAPAKISSGHISSSDLGPKLDEKFRERRFQSLVVAGDITLFMLSIYCF